MPDDYYVSQYSGEEIDALLGIAGAGTVRYDAAQTLTDAQKKQARGNISAMQGIESTDHPGCYYVLNGSAVEWINPPMQLGVEYRTTERYLDKPVYVQLVNMGAAPSPGTAKIINISNAIYISLVGTLDYGSYRQVLPFFKEDGTLGSMILNSGDAIVAQFHNTEDYSSQNLHVLAKYIKSTD